MEAYDAQQLIPTLLLLARPGAGKSEVIRFLRELEPERRAAEFHIGRLHEIDDFPMLWSWFEEDAILTELGFPRLHTDNDGYFRESYLWDLLIRRIDLEWEKAQRDGLDADNGWTNIVEFSRGTEHGGFSRAFAHCSPAMLSSAAILYINVSWEESLRKNRSRFNPDRPDSILEHGLPDEKLYVLYHGSDWHELAGGSAGTLFLQGTEVPYAVMENEDDVTTNGGRALAERLKPVMDSLWEIFCSKKEGHR